MRIFSKKLIKYTVIPFILVIALLSYNFSSTKAFFFVYFAKYGQISIIKYLVQHGVDVNIQSGPGKITALHFAADADQINTVNELLKLGANVDAKQSWGGTPLVRSIIIGDFETSILLLKHGADLDYAIATLNSKLDITIRDNLLEKRREMVIFLKLINDHIKSKATI